jgi:hypothetical protein
MAWVKFPNQINDLLKLRRALAVAVELSPEELRDDGIYGEALLEAGVIRTQIDRETLANLPSSRQPHRTTARGLRQHFMLLGCMRPVTDGVALTEEGMTIAGQQGDAISPTEYEIWRSLLSELTFPHPLYPDLSEGVVRIRPTHVILAILEPGPVPTRGLALAFSAVDESSNEIARVRALAGC